MAPRRRCKIIKAVNSKNVKILWDLYHMHITEGDLCGHLREGFAADAIAYLQIADHPGRNEPGTGEINYPRVLQGTQGAQVHRLRRAGVRAEDDRGGRGAGGLRGGQLVIQADDHGARRTGTRNRLGSESRVCLRVLHL